MLDVATLARLEHDNLVEACSLAASQAKGSLVRRADGVALLLTGMPLRLFNQVVIAEDGARPEAVAAAVAIARERGDRFVLNLRAGTDDRFVPLVDELGLVEIDDNPWMPGMAMQPVAHVGPPLAAGHEIRQVTDAAGVEDHVATAAAGFGMPEAWARAVVTIGMAEHPDARLYVAYADGQPVASGLGVRTGRTIGVYNIATVESARRRGLGAAMTMRVVADGAADGCDVAILQASDMGQPIYERLGFRTVVEYMGYVDPSSLSG